MKTTTILKPTLKVPKVWADLLEVDLDLEEAKKKPIMEDTDLNDPTPMRDDHREVSIMDQGYTVTLMLSSGDSNYWLSYIVDGPNDLHHEGFAFFDLPDEQDEIYLDDRSLQETDQTDLPEDYIPPLYFHVEQV